jgi:hypothetical protein
VERLSHGGRSKNKQAEEDQGDDHQPQLVIM